MTGFADAQGAVAGWGWMMDLRGVNGRGLDLRLRVPDRLEGVEQAARKALQAALSRGNVTLNIRVSQDGTAEGLRVDEMALTAALDTIVRIEEAAVERGLELRRATAVDIAAMRGVADHQVEVEDTSALSQAVIAALGPLIEAFVASRAAEGAALLSVLEEKLGDVARLTVQARDALGPRAAHQRATLEAALKRLLDVTETPDEARLAQEMAIIAVKSDVTEELDRLDAHVAAAEALLSAGGPVGRKLDFLMQEFNREANTLCAKAQSGQLTRIGLDLKTVIDQMREQVQNIE